MEFTEGNLITRIWIFSRHLESYHACFEHLSLETCAKRIVGRKSVFIFHRCRSHSVIFGVSCFQKYIDLSYTLLSSLQQHYQK